MSATATEETTAVPQPAIGRVWSSKEDAEQATSQLNDARVANPKTGKLSVPFKVYEVETSKDVEAGHKLYIAGRSPANALSLAGLEYGISCEREDKPGKKPTVKEFVDMLNDDELDELCNLLESKKS